MAAEQAQMFVALDTTFGAFANVARPYLQDTISETPPTLDVGTASCRACGPSSALGVALFQDLEPGIEAVRVNGPTIARARDRRAHPERLDELNRQLAPTAQPWQDLTTTRAQRRPRPPRRDGADAASRRCRS